MPSTYSAALFFSDPCSVFSRVLQEDDLDVLGAFSCLIPTIKEVDKLTSKGLEHWPTYSAVLKKLVDRDGEVEYQLQTLIMLPKLKCTILTMLQATALRSSAA